MRKLLIVYFLLASNHLIQGQGLQYQVEINNHRAGSFKQRTEVGQKIETFTSLNLQILTLEDTFQYSSNAHFIESGDGFLQSVSWSKVFQDTLSYEISFANDSLGNVDKGNSILYGPERIRQTSKQNLDSIGKKICYPTFSTELNQITEVERELLGYTIEKTQKLNIVKESIGNRSTIGKYNKDFHLIQTSSPSPFGEIRLTLVNSLRKPQFFESGFFEQNRLLSNIRFPDPNRIQAIKLKIALDNMTSPIRYANQKTTTQDSSSLTLIITDTEEKWSAPDSWRIAHPEILWSKAKTKNILDSLGIDPLKSIERLEAIHSFAQNCTNPNLDFYQLACASQFPARLVYGYAYDQWFWSPKVWTEAMIDDVWVTQDLTSEIESNLALKLALYKSEPGASLSESYFESIPKVRNIQVQSFTLDGKKYSVSSQVFPYYFENPVYENEGLGIRFNIPDGFEISDDGTTAPSPVFLVLENDYQEKINFSQMLIQPDKSAEQSAKKAILDYLNDDHIILNKAKKRNFWYGFEGQKGAIAIPQGSSFIFITIQHEDPEFMILVLTRKNLLLKY